VLVAQSACSCRAAESAHPGAKKALAEVYHAEHKQQAMKAAKAFAADYGAKRPKAAAKITDHLDVLLAFYDFPAKPRGAFAHHEPDRVKPTGTLASFACSAPRLRRRILRAIKAGDTIWQSRWQPGGDCLVDIALLGREAGRSAAVA
jgi:hypothetical protein